METARVSLGTGIGTTIAKAFEAVWSTTKAVANVANSIFSAINKFFAIYEILNWAYKIFWEEEKPTINPAIQNMFIGTGLALIVLSMGAFFIGPHACKVGILTTACEPSSYGIGIISFIGGSYFLTKAFLM